MFNALKASRRQVLLTGTSLGLVAAGGAHASIAQASSIRGGASPNPWPERRRPDQIRLDDGWRFALGNLDDPAKDFNFGTVEGKVKETYAKQGHNICDCARADFDDSDWERISIPHDWAVALPFVHHPEAKGLPADAHSSHRNPLADRGYKPLGREFPATSVGWYRRLIDASLVPAGKRVRLDFDAVFRDAIVIFNGYQVLQHEDGYTPFSVDVTDFLNTDGKPNVLVLRVNASLAEGWFYEGAGIYRHVWLAVHDPVHVPRYGVVARPQIDGTVKLATTIRNDSKDPATVRLASSVPGEGSGAAREVAIPAWGEVEVPQSFTVASPRLWSVEEPHLYEIETRLGDHLAAVTRIGFRSIRFDPDEGFFLNGKRVELRGTCNHQDHAGVGVAVPDALWYYRLGLLRQMGSNAYRSAHNPPAPELLDACDELGLLVIDETRMMTSSPQGTANLEAMLRRDRNHPSIILWSIGNEEPQQGTTRGGKIAAAMKRTVRRLDPTRPITAAMNGGYGKGISPVLDVIGFNYNGDKIGPYHKTFPDQPIVGTETASTLATRGIYKRSAALHQVPAYDTVAPPWGSTAEQWWPHFDAEKFISGGFIWAGFDYRGEPTPYAFWPSISSQFGIFDTCGFPKDEVFYYRAWWRPDKPMVHLFPHWNWHSGEKVRLWAYSNADEVELYVNGHSQGRKSMPRNRHVEWTVPFTPGRIEARAYRGGRLVATDTRETAGSPARIVLTANRTDLEANGRDCAVLKAEVVDEKGRMVPRAANMVSFKVKGDARVIGVGNGDPNCHEPDKASQRSAFNGLCSAIVQTGKDGGPIEIVAMARGVSSGTLRIKAT